MKVITDAETNMDYSVVIEAGTGRKTGKISSDRAAMANEKKEKGLSSVKKGPADYRNGYRGGGPGDP